MQKQWLRVSYWTPDGESELVAWVEDIEKDVLKKNESDFVKLADVRWIEYLPEEEGELDYDDEACDCDCDCEDEECEEELTEEDKKLLAELVDDVEDDEEGDEEDDFEEIVVRQEDDLQYGTGSTLYLKREHIISIAPVRGDFAELWDATVGEEEKSAK
ncbi:MAG: hypothetical protein WC712_07775 [Candidatus Brocadiia bacterium]